jgi:uncharacterized membrane protein YhaH (DUF805 family)
MCRIRGNHDTRSRQIEWTRGGKGETTMSWYIAALKKYADFNGRAGKAEFWMFTLINTIISVILYLIDGEIMPGSNSHLLYTLYGLAVLVPSLAVSVRRLHDTGRSGWWILINVIPILGQLVYLVFLLQDSQGANQYGSSPRLATA